MMHWSRDPYLSQSMSNGANGGHTVSFVHLGCDSNGSWERFDGQEMFHNALKINNGLVISKDRAPLCRCFLYGSSVNNEKVKAMPGPKPPCGYIIIAVSFSLWCTSHPANNQKSSSLNCAQANLDFVTGTLSLWIY